MTDKDNIENLTEPSTVQSYINYLADEDGVVWMEAGWDSDDESIVSFANLLYELHSGQLMAESLEFIKDQCQTLEKKRQYQKLLIALNDLFFVGLETNKPVVSPTQVFPQYGDK